MLFDEGLENLIHCCLRAVFEMGLGLFALEAKCCTTENPWHYKRDVKDWIQKAVEKKFLSYKSLLLDIHSYFFAPVEFVRLFLLSTDWILVI